MLEATGVDFWQVHGWAFLIGLVFFPRITMLVAGTALEFMKFASPWGILAWIGWMFAPYLVIAILASTFYWDTNPGLCVGAWILAVSGTGGESYTATRKSSKDD